MYSPMSITQFLSKSHHFQNNFSLSVLANYLPSDDQLLLTLRVILIISENKFF